MATDRINASMRRKGLRGSACLIALVALLVGASAHAKVLRYSIEIRDREATSYIVEIPVRHPGTFYIDAEWPGSRTLAFRVEGPGHPYVKTRRAGPSPQHLEFEVNEDAIVDGESWELHIRSLPDRGRAEGILTLTLPSPSDPETPEAPLEPSPTAPESEPWARPRSAPAGSPEELAQVFDRVESFRSWVVDEDGTPRQDACGWQSDLLHYLADRRNELEGGDRGFDKATSRYFSRLARTVRRIDELRWSDDPILAGPAPETELRRRAWEAVRRERIEPLEHELDALGEAVRRGYVSGLIERRWAMRFVACLTACERYFEQRTRLGEGRAPNGDLAQAQWDGILAAADALDALATAANEAPLVVGEAQTAP
jgi:hypothetical protein